MNQKEAKEQARYDIAGITITLGAILAEERKNYEVLHGKYPYYSMTNNDVPINHPQGEFVYLARIKSTLEMAVEKGLPKDEAIPPGIPEYVEDLFREE